MSEIYETIMTFFKENNISQYGTFKGWVFPVGQVAL